MGFPSYANAATVRAAADVASTPKADAAIARVLDDASRSIEDMCRGRKFYPWAGTRTMDWNDRAGVNTDSRKLWLDINECLSLTELQIAGTVVTDYRLGPQVNGEPFRFIETTGSGSSTFKEGTDGYQDAVSLTGVFGWTDTLADSGLLTSTVATTTDTTLEISDGSTVDVGDAVKVDDEYMIVNGRSWVDTAEDLTAALTVDSDDNSIPVADGSAYTAGELLLVDTERMLITDIAGDNLIVVRAHEGTTLAGHAIAASVYADRGRTVERGALGTTAQTHTNLASVLYRHVPPAAVTSLCVAEAEVLLAQEASGYGRTVGQGENEREARGAGLKDKRDQVRKRYAMKGQVYASGVVRR